MHRDSATTRTTGHWRSAGCWGPGQAFFDIRKQLAQSEGRPVCEFFLLRKPGQVEFVGFVRQDGKLMLAAVNDGYGMFTPGEPMEASTVFAKIK
ncbi:MAG TPA: hypothetical protein VM925_04635 [Labilithrix sp.]|jgi:hypothetical protein|nr:hypothetical protein [Labilithrix sp.]